MLDVSVMAAIRALGSAGEPDVYTEVAHLFLADVPVHLAALGAAAADLSNCMQNCESADDCRDGYSCGTVPAFGGMAPENPQKTCLPPSPFGAGGGPSAP